MNISAHAQILLYNIREESRLRPIRRYLNKAGVSVRIIQTAEYRLPLGTLFELPGFSAAPVFNLGQNFTEEMLVMNSFGEKQMEDFFQFFKENQLSPVELKAVLTPVNQYWNSLKLHEELLAEHHAMKS